MTTLIIARHGNTFESGEAPRRVGARTDLPLTEKGLEQGKRLGAYLKENGILPATIYTSKLQRTIQTATEIMNAAGLSLTLQIKNIFNEIDYGPDENLTEDQVIARIGAQAMADWEEKAILPPGWSPDAATITRNWQNFSQEILKPSPGKTSIVITSNGIARFALLLAGNSETIRKQSGLKLATGAFGVLDHNPETGWVVRDWNIRP